MLYLIIGFVAITVALFGYGRIEHAGVVSRDQIIAEKNVAIETAGKAAKDQDALITKQAGELGDRENTIGAQNLALKRITDDEALRIADGENFKKQNAAKQASDRAAIAKLLAQPRGQTTEDKQCADACTLLDGPYLPSLLAVPTAPLSAAPAPPKSP